MDFSNVDEFSNCFLFSHMDSIKEFVFCTLLNIIYDCGFNPQKKECVHFMQVVV